MTKTWKLVSIVVLALSFYALAHATRYEVVEDVKVETESETTVAVWVWDRWTHSACLHIPSRDPLCSD